MSLCHVISKLLLVEFIERHLMHTILRRVRSPSLSDKLKRVLWLIVFTTAFKPSPTPLHAWRGFLLRMFGARIAHGARIYASVEIWAPWNLAVGRNATIGWRVRLYNVAMIEIGESAVVSQFAHLCTASHDCQTDFQLQTAEIIVGSNAWIASDAFIGPGVKVDDNAVVAARAVVTRSVCPNNIVAGNPAKQIGLRP